MYPRNAASPPRLYLGPVIQISDGAVQTSGVTVTVTPEGGTETASGGTVAYSTKGGVWYTPTQAETNYTAFSVEAWKTGCLPTGISVITTAASTAGQVVTASGTVTTVTNQLTAAQIATGVWQDATAGDFTTASSIGKALYVANVAPGAAGGHFIAGTNAATSITTALTANITGNVSGSVGSVTGAVGSVTGAVGSVTGNVGGNVTGSVGSVATGGITAASIAADAIGASELAADAVTEIVTGVWNAATASYGGAGTYGQAVEDVLADTNELQTDWANGGRLDLLLDGASSAGDPWTTALPGAYGAGTAGKIIGDNINAPIATVDTVVDAIKVKTDYLPSATAGNAGGVFIAGTNAATSVTTALTANITGNLSGSVGSVTGAVGSVTGAVGSVTGAVGSVTGNVGGNVAGSVGSVTGAVGSVTGAVGSVTAGVTLAADAVSAAALSAAAIDEILDEQIGDGTLTMRQALRVLVAGMAGKLSGAATTTVTIRNLADSANVVVATVDADGNRSATTVTP